MTEPPDSKVSKNPRRQSITIDDKEFHLDEEMLDGLFSFKHLLERKLIPANFGSRDPNRSMPEEEQRQQYELQQ